MISIKRSTRHLFAILLAALWRRLRCRNTTACWVRTFVIILCFMFIWMQGIIRNSVDDSRQLRRHTREVNGFPTKVIELSIQETKIQQPHVIMNRLEKMMEHIKNMTTGNPVDTGTEINTKVLETTQANHEIIPKMVENWGRRNSLIKKNNQENLNFSFNRTEQRLKKIEPYYNPPEKRKSQNDSNIFDEIDVSSKTREKEKYVDYIKLKIEDANKEQIIYNEEIFGGLNNDSLVILVQVHNRAFYLQHLIDSLATARYIDQALLIFSHDIYDEEMNDLIKAIKFCKVMQIFFPYSIQTHPGTFPGNDSRDCPRDIGKQKALQIGCLNAEHPDKYGHYRESKFTQIKHHWWWKMNHVFNHLNVTSKYSGFVLFLEEDHYVAEDFIHVMRMMGPKCDNESLCQFLGLGLDIIKSGPSNQATMSLFQTNLGLAFNRETYLNSIKSCAKEFCEFDDYNWDWSLNYITNKCDKDPKLSMILMAQRVFHIGECGTHIRHANCDIGIILSVVENKIKSLGLYPTNIELLENKIVSPELMENGGWGDKRDHELCINMTHMP